MIDTTPRCCFGRCTKFRAEASLYCARHIESRLKNRLEKLDNQFRRIHNRLMQTLVDIENANNAEHRGQLERRLGVLEDRQRVIRYIQRMGVG
jgi:hypothetical protein